MITIKQDDYYSIIKRDLIDDIDPLINRMLAFYKDKEFLSGNCIVFFVNVIKNEVSIGQPSAGESICKYKYKFLDDNANRIFDSFDKLKEYMLNENERIFNMIIKRLSNNTKLLLSQDNNNLSKLFNDGDLPYQYFTPEILIDENSLSNKIVVGDDFLNYIDNRPEYSKLIESKFSSIYFFKSVRFNCIINNLNNLFFNRSEKMSDEYITSLSRHMSSYLSNIVVRLIEQNFPFTKSKKKELLSQLTRSDVNIDYIYNVLKIIRTFDPGAYVDYKLNHYVEDLIFSHSDNDQFDTIIMNASDIQTIMLNVEAADHNQFSAKKLKIINNYYNRTDEDLLNYIKSVGTVFDFHRQSPSFIKAFQDAEIIEDESQSSLRYYKV